MTAGFQVIGDAGNVLVSQDYKNMQLVEKGAAALPATGGLAPGVSFSRSGLVAPILFVAGSRSALGYACKQVSGATAFLIFADGSVAADVTYYIFDTAVGANPHGALQVYDATGAVTFDSGGKVLRVVDQRSISAGNASTSANYVNGRNYAVAHVAFGIREVYAYDQARSFIASTTPVGGVTTGLIKQALTLVGTVNYRNANLLVADVTGY